MELPLSYCGLACDECPAGRATRRNDRALLASTAKAWSKAFKTKYAPEDILCDSCKSPSERKSRYCRECKVRPCARGRGLGTCAECDAYPCDTLAAFLRTAPEAKRNLEAERRKGKAKKGDKKGT